MYCEAWIAGEGLLYYLRWGTCTGDGSFLEVFLPAQHFSGFKCGTMLWNTPFSHLYGNMGVWVSL